MNEIDEGIKKHQFPVIQQISHGDVVYSIGNIINNILFTLHGDRW